MIVPTLAKIIIREHLYKPFQGRVLTMGRQTICMTPKDSIELLKSENCPPIMDAFENTAVLADQNTRVGKGTEFISDKLFFSLFGVKELSVIDVSSYEGADIIHDLNFPVPESLHGQFDFIIDGGTFDHLFDIRVAFENVVKLLKPGGRVLQWNATSNFTGAAYLSFGPDLFYDYYLINKFVDCKVYVCELDIISQATNWKLFEFTGQEKYDHVVSPKILVSIVLAEKGPESTWDKLPIQMHYRDKDIAEEYDVSMRLIDRSKRNIFPITGANKYVDLRQKKSIESIKPKLIEMGLKLPLWLQKIMPNFIKAKLYKRLNARGGLDGYYFIGRV